jgi:ferredoxin
MKHEVLIEETGEHYACSDDESVLEGMVRLGRRGIPLGCRGGGCGVCKVQITAGEYRSRVMSRQHVTEAEQAAGCVLACRVHPLSDLSLRVVGKMEKTVCRVPSALLPGMPERAKGT